MSQKIITFAFLYGAVICFFYAEEAYQRNELGMLIVYGTASFGCAINIFRTPIIKWWKRRTLKLSREKHDANVV